MKSAIKPQSTKHYGLLIPKSLWSMWSLKIHRAHEHNSLLPIIHTCPRRFLPYLSDIGPVNPPNKQEETYPAMNKTAISFSPYP